MFSSKLIKTLKALNPNEFRQLGLFLKSPYFVSERNGKNIIPLFEYLQTYYPVFESKQISKEVVYLHVFPDEKYIKGKLEKVMTALLQEIRRFIIQYSKDQQGQTTQDMLALARFYRQKKMDRFFRRTLEQIRTAQEQNQKRDKDFFFNQYLIDKEWVEYESFYNTRQKDLNLPSTLRNLDIFYIIAKQEYSSWLLSQDRHHAPLDLQDDLVDLEKLTRFRERKDYLDVPLIIIYDQALRLLQDSEQKEEAFKALNQLLEQYQDRIPLEQLKAMQALCRNYSVQFYNEGNRDYLQISFDLYKKHLEEGFLYYNNGLLQSTIKNIVVLGLKLKEIDWVYQFLEKYKDRVVGTKHKKEVYHFNLASYYFAIKAYDDALQYLSEHYEDWYYQIASRRLEIKIYYETQSILLDSKLEAYKIYIFRIAKSKLTALQKKGNNNFADMVRQINAPKTIGNPVRIKRLIERVKTKKVIAEEEWLLEKLNELL